MKLHPHSTAVRPSTAIELLASRATPLSRVQLILDDMETDYNVWQHPDQRMNRSIADYARLLNLAIDDAKLTVRDKAKLRVGLGLRKGPIAAGFPLCNLRIRRKAYRTLYEVVKKHWVEPTTLQRRWFFVTLFTDRGNALEYDTVVDFNRTRRDLNRILAATGLNAVGLLELQAASNFPAGGHGGTLMLHGHYIGCTDDPAYDAPAVARSLCDRNVLTNWLGALTAKIDPIGSLLQLRDKCRYINKPPIKAKFLVPDQLERTGYRLDSADVTAPVALRLAEVLGHLDLLECMAGTGTGVAFKRDWRDGMRAWHNRFRKTIDVDVPDLIQQVWQTDRSRLARPQVDIRRETSQPPPTAWFDAMAPYVAKVAVNREDYAARQASYHQMRQSRSQDAQDL